MTDLTEREAAEFVMTDLSHMPASCYMIVVLAGLTKASLVMMRQA